jgi:2-methylcitrate dehydratase PrpD
MDNKTETAIEKLAANVVDTRFENFDKATLENTRYRIIDTLGCLIGGSGDTGNPELVNILRGHGGREEATILVHGGKVPASEAALINCVMARSFDFGPVSPIVEGVHTPGHISETTVPTVVSLAEAVNASGREMVCALLAGDDITARILAASGFGFTLGWDGTGTVNAFGAAAIAGRLLGLNKLQMRNAFGIVLNQVGSTFQIIWDGTMAFKLPQGLSARAGVLSAELARAGWTGPEDALFSKFGYYKMFTEGAKKPEVLTAGLGRVYYYDSVTKPYPECRIPHAAIDATMSLMRQHSIKAADVGEVILYLHQGGIDHVCGHPFQIGPFPHGNAAFSYQFAVATALVYGAVRPEHFTEKAIRDPKLKEYFGKIKFQAVGDVPFEGARVKLVLKDGREFTEQVDVARGNPVFNPMSNEEKLAKFWNNVEFCGRISRPKAEKLLAAIMEIEKLGSVREIVPLMVT